VSEQTVTGVAAGRRGGVGRGLFGAALVAAACGLATAPAASADDRGADLPPLAEAREGASEAAAEVLASIEALLSGASDGDRPMNGDEAGEGDAGGDGWSGDGSADAGDGDGSDGGDAGDAGEEETDELKQMREEQQRLQAEYSLMMQRQKNEMLEMELERQRLQTESSLRSARQQEELSRLRDEIERMSTEAQHARAEMEAELAEMRRMVDLINAEKQLRQAKRSRELDELRAETERLQTEAGLANARIGALRTDINEIQTRAQREVADINARMQVLDTVERSKDRVLARVDYPLDPVEGDTLFISDRRIEMNGPIISGTADWVVERIDYFNNRSAEKPIFLVIDNCPGGSVMQGYRIVNAIERSDAPVHVVVKSYAASMAAVITTLADHSYALPNAVILHHQMSSGMRGNLTQQAEQLENAMEWSRRLHEPVVDKMGITYDRFVELMYENDSNGDWEEFADVAVDLEWVDEVVMEVREQGVRERPRSAAPSFFFWFMAEPEQANPMLSNMRRDEQGRAFIQLPPLQPFDHYFLHDPNGFYRW